MNNTESSFDTEKFCLGKLCKREHDYEGTGQSLMYVKKRECVECARLYRRNWYKGNREKAKNGVYCWQKRNPEKVRQQGKKYYQRNKEKCLSRSKKWRQDNPDKCRERERNRDPSRLLYFENWKNQNPDAFKAAQKKYNRKCIKLLSDKYVKQRLSKQFNIKASQMPPEIIDLKREQLKIHRQTETLRKELENGTD